jgi:hypothetical protein
VTEEQIREAREMGALRIVGTRHAGARRETLVRLLCGGHVLYIEDRGPDGVYRCIARSMDAQAVREWEAQG